MWLCKKCFHPIVAIYRGATNKIDAAGKVCPMNDRYKVEAHYIKPISYLCNNLECRNSFIPVDMGDNIHEMVIKKIAYWEQSESILEEYRSAKWVERI